VLKTTTTTNTNIYHPNMANVSAVVISRRSFGLSVPVRLWWPNWFLLDGCLRETVPIYATIWWPTPLWNWMSGLHYTATGHNITRGALSVQLRRDWPAIKKKKDATDRVQRLVSHALAFATFPSADGQQRRGQVLTDGHIASGATCVTPLMSDSDQIAQAEPTFTFKGM
jgi:hypothetical protein